MIVTTRVSNNLMGFGRFGGSIFDTVAQVQQQIAATTGQTGSIQTLANGGKVWVPSSPATNTGMRAPVAPRGFFDDPMNIALVGVGAVAVIGGAIYLKKHRSKKSAPPTIAGFARFMGLR